MLFTYVCKFCNNEDLHKIFQDWSGKDDGTWHEDVCNLTEEEINNLPEWDDPRFHYETIKYGKELPEILKCSKCGENANLVFNEYEPPAGFVKGNCFTNRERERKFHEKGLNKEQAEKFYKDSIEASKERMNSGGQHYKSVVPDYEYFRKIGKATRNNDQRAADKKKYFKEANIKFREMMDQRNKRKKK